MTAPKMILYFSTSTGGFYDSRIHAKLPTDAVEITAETRSTMLAGERAGKRITGDASGAPMLIDRPAETHAQASVRLSRVVRKHVDGVAQSLGYSDMISAVSYADEPAVPKFQVQGAALRAWRSRVWASVSAAFAAVAITPPSTMPTAAQLIASLPEFVAPTAHAAPVLAPVIAA